MAGGRGKAGEKGRARKSQLRRGCPELCELPLAVRGFEEFLRGSVLSRRVPLQLGSIHRSGKAVRGGSRLRTGQQVLQGRGVRGGAAPAKTAPAARPAGQDSRT